MTRQQTAGAFAALLLAVGSTALAQPAPPAPAPAPEARAEAAATPSFRISGLVYGDFYYVAGSHREELEGRNGFWLRRIYLTFDHTLSKSLSARLRLEANSKGDFTSTGVNTVYVKDASLRWTRDRHALSFGLAGTPHLDFVDAFQGYRSLEKSPLDLYRWDSARDLGLLAQGTLGAEDRTRYAFQFGNGSGTGSETDNSKSVRGQLIHRFASGLVVEGYADWQDRPEGRDVSTLEAFLGWERPSWRASLQYARQQRRRATAGGDDLSLDLVSAFASARLTPRLTLVSRIDRSLDPVPGGETIDYLPFAETTKPLFGLLGLDLALHKDAHLIPNLELVRYSRTDEASRRATDLVPRLTVFFSW